MQKADSAGDTWTAALHRPAMSACPQGGWGGGTDEVVSEVISSSWAEAADHPPLLAVQY